VTAEYENSNNPIDPERKYVYASYVDEPCLLVDATGVSVELYDYHCNNLYSVAALTDSLGNITERYAYSAYGDLFVLEPNGTTLRANSIIANSYTFTGRRLDVETGIYYYRAR